MILVGEGQARKKKNILYGAFLRETGIHGFFCTWDIGMSSSSSSSFSTARLSLLDLEAGADSAGFGFKKLRGPRQISVSVVSHIPRPRLSPPSPDRPPLKNQVLTTPAFWVGEGTVSFRSRISSGICDRRGHKGGCIVI